MLDSTNETVADHDVESLAEIAVLSKPAEGSWSNSGKEDRFLLASLGDTVGLKVKFELQRV